MGRLNPVQVVAAKGYGDLSLLTLPDKPLEKTTTQQTKSCGDFLFYFLMLELEDVGTDPLEALKRVTRARRQLEDVERAIFSTRSGLWPISKD